MPLLRQGKRQTTDPVLERLFQTAITAAKKVKSTVRLTAVENSVIYELKKVLDKDFESIEGLKCMVIGNGEIGRLAADFMVQQKQMSQLLSVITRQDRLKFQTAVIL